MATLTELRPNGLDTQTGMTNVGGAATLWEALDDESDTTYATTAANTGGNITLLLDDMPSDFASMSKCIITVRAAMSDASGDDTWSVRAHLVTSAGANLMVVSATAQNLRAVNNTITNFTFDVTGWFSGTNNNKTTWDGAKVYIEILRSQVMGGDGSSARVYRVGITGTYATYSSATPTVSDQSHSILESGTVTGENAFHAACSDGTSVYMLSERSPAMIYKYDPADLTTPLISTEFPNDGAHGIGEDMRIDGTRILCCFRNTAGSTRVSSVPMSNLAPTTDVVNDSTQINSSGGAPSICTDGTYVYMVTSFTSLDAEVRKYRLSDGVLMSECAIGKMSRGHAIIIDANGKIFAGGGTSAGDDAWVAKIDAATMALEECISIEAITGASTICDELTDDGTYVYVGVEAGDDNPVRIHKTTMAVHEIILPTAVAIWGLAYDGTYVWIQYSNGVIYRIVPGNLATVYRYTTGLSNTNEFVPIAPPNTYFMTRYSASPGIAVFEPSDIAAAPPITRSITDAEGLADAAAGVQTILRPTTDAEGLTDAATGVQTSVRSATDGLGLADAMSQSLFTAHARSATDALGLVDAAVAAGAIVRAATDALGLVDAPSPFVAASRSVTDAEALADGIASQSATARAAGDTSGLLDSVDRVHTLPVIVTDAESSTDGISSSSGASRPVTDAGGLTDAATGVQGAVRSATDAEGLADTATGDATTPILRDVTDAEGLTDAATGASAAQRSATDAEGLTDAATRVASSARSVTDALGLADGVQVGQVIARSVTDGAVLGDAVLRNVITVQVFDELLGLADDATRLHGAIAVVLDQTSLADSLSVSQYSGITTVAVWDGTQWAMSNLYRWTGALWVPMLIRRWNGVDWEPLP